MKRLIIFVLTLCVMSAAFAINGVIKGKVTDATTGKPLEFVTVSLSDGAGKAINGAISDIDGEYSFAGLAAGTYEVKFTFLGYKEFSRKVEVTASSPVRGLDVKMIEDTQMLGEVEVVGQKPQMRFEIDKRVFNADQAIAAIGGSASDLLSNVPSIDVDTEGTISLRGNSSVTIWINGKDAGLTSDNQSEILEQLPAETIDRIEVITNPSAKYSPEGTAGIINIILKDDAKPGYYGSVQAQADIQGGVRASANINFTAGKWSGYANAGYRHNRRTNGGYTNREMTDDGTYLNQVTDGLRKRDNGFFRGGINYKATDKDVLSLSGFGMVGGGSTDNTINYVSNVPGSYQTAVRQTLGDNTMRGGNVMLTYDRQFDPNRMLSLSASHNRWSMDNGSDYLQTSNYADRTSHSLQRQSSDMNNTGWEFQADYSNAFNENHKLEAGYKGELRDETSPLITLYGTNEADLQPQHNLDNTFGYKRNVQAAYVSYSGKVGNLGIQFGLRGEYSLIKTSSEYFEAGVHGYTPKDTIFNKPKFDLFPSIFLSYSLPKGNELQVNYTRRIRRPWGGMLNSFTNITDSSNISSGNPDLDPQYSNAFELNYIKNWERHMLSVSTYYRSTDDVFERVSYMDGNGVMNTTWLNVTRSVAAGAELVVKNKIHDFIDLTTTINMYYSKLNGFNEWIPSLDAWVSGDSEENFAYDAKLIANFILPRDFSLQLTGSYRSKETIAQGTRRPTYTLDAGIKKSFMDGKINVALTGRDLLDSRHRHTITSGPGFDQESESWRQGRNVRLTISYSFGNMRGSKNRDAGRDDDNMSEGMYEEY